MENGAGAVAVQNSESVNLFAFTNIDRAWGFCVKLAESQIIPDTFRGNPASCLIALDMANRMRRNPMEVMQAMYIVHGKPGFSSSFLIGLINSCGLFERLRFEYLGKPDTSEWGCRAWTIEKSTGEKLVGSIITMKMAKEEGWTSNKKWQTMPETMLRYRAASFFSRAYCPDLTGGIHSIEELSDSNMLEREAAGTVEARFSDEQTVGNDVSPEEQKAAMMEQLMNASVDDKQTPPQTPASEAMSPTSEQPGAFPLDAAFTVEEPEGQAPQHNSPSSLEVLRKELLALMGPDNMGLRPDEQERYLARITGKDSLKDLTIPDLRAVINEARAEMARRSEDGR